MDALLPRDLVASGVEQFARLFHAWKECAPEIQSVIERMCALIADPRTSVDDRSYAAQVVLEALHPHLTADAPGELERILATPEALAASKELDDQEAIFVDRVRGAMDRCGLTPEQLAQRSGVAPAVVANVLAGRCRPQRRTIAQLAGALGTSPAELWPELQSAAP